jgi:hypothetical protein
MTEPTPTTEPTPMSKSTTSKLTPLRCFTGALVAGTIAVLLYQATGGVAATFATHAVQSDNFIVMRMSAAVRTLVIGMFALATGVFGMAAIGLGGLGFQLLFKPATE